MFQCFVSVVKPVYSAGLSSIDPTKSKSLRKVLTRKKFLRSRHVKPAKVRNAQLKYV